MKFDAIQFGYPVNKAQISKMREILKSNRKEFTHPIECPICGDMGEKIDMSVPIPVGESYSKEQADFDIKLIKRGITPLVIQKHYGHGLLTGIYNQQPSFMQGVIVPAIILGIPFALIVAFIVSFKI